MQALATANSSKNMDLNHYYIRVGRESEAHPAFRATKISNRD